MHSKNHPRRSGFPLCINILQRLHGILHQRDIQVAVAHTELVDELLLLLLVLHDDAVVQLQEGTVVLGLDAVEVGVAAVLLQHGLEYAVVVQGLGDEDAQTLAGAAEAVDADEVEEDDEEEQDADGDGAEADEAHAAGDTGGNGDVVVDDVAGVFHGVTEADQRQTAADGDGAGDVGADTDDDDGHGGAQEHHGEEHGGAEARAAVGEHVDQHDGHGQAEGASHNGQGMAQGDDGNVNGFQNAIHNLVHGM